MQHHTLTRGCELCAQDWNARRVEVLSDVVTEHLLPTLRAELRTRLLAESREAVLRDIGDRLWDFAVQAPVKVRPGSVFSPQCILQNVTCKARC